MRKLKSCGVLIFRQQPELSFLLMKHPHRYDIPKGHIKKGESETECAMRELDEETGFSGADVRIEEGFEFRDTYFPKYKRFGGEKVEKTLVVFLGRLLADREVTLTEHQGHEWIPWRPPKIRT